MKRLSNDLFALWIATAFVVPVAAMVLVRFVIGSALSPFWADFLSMLPIAITTPAFVWLLRRYLMARDGGVAAGVDERNPNHG